MIKTDFKLVIWAGYWQDPHNLSQCIKNIVIKLIKKNKKQIRDDVYESHAILLRLYLLAAIIFINSLWATYIGAALLLQCR